MQVGAAGIDDFQWEGDRQLSLPRPSYKITAAKPGTDMTGNAAAAFAAASVFYASKLDDRAYSDKLLRHAQSLYKWSTSKPQAIYSDSVHAARLNCTSMRCFGADACRRELRLRRRAGLGVAAHVYALTSRPR